MKPFNITEKEIRHAMNHSVGCSDAARYLGVSLFTFKIYASSYTDEETGKNLYELHKNQAGKSFKRRQEYLKKAYEVNLENILTGQKPIFNGKSIRFRDALFISGYIPTQCAQCGYSEKRQIDYRPALQIQWLDGNHFNNKIENLKFMCFNCLFLEGAHVFATFRKARYAGE